MDVPTIGKKRHVIAGATGMVSGYARLAFMRYKGEAENAPPASKCPRLYIFRPAYIYPAKPRKEPNLSYRVLRRIYPLFRALFPNQVSRADDLARAMVDIVAAGTGAAPSQVFENRDIRSIFRSLHRPQDEEEEGLA